MSTFSPRIAVFGILETATKKGPGKYPGPFSNHGDLITIMDACQASV
jgi:hypothetical protein